MNAVRVLAVSAIVCLIGAGVRAEDKADNAKLMIGKWEVSKADDGTIPMGSTVEFTKDGKIKFAFKMGDMDVAFEGTYTVEKDAFTMVMKMGDMEHKQTVTIKKISDKTMSTVDKDGKAVELTRKK
jgi:uncharacterized protein (TIGR03066 family)